MMHRLARALLARGDGTHRQEDFDLSDSESEAEEEGEGEQAASATDGTDDDQLTRYERDARSWDIFMALMRAMRPFDEEDTVSYREARGVETFNAAGATMQEWKRLNPNALSACPHVALCVLPRQQVQHGDHERRGADHGEAYGASIKDSIHRRCLRRKLGKTSSTHRKILPDGSIKTWTQGPLKVSRVMQIFRTMAVTERGARDAGSTKYLQRKHFKLKSTGFATAAQAVAKQCKEAPASDAIYSIVSRRVQESREYA